MNSFQCEAAHSFCDCCELSSCWIGSPLASPDDKFLLYLNSEDVLSRRPWARVMWENKEQALSSTLPFEDLMYKNLDDSFCYVLNSVHKLVNLFICMGQVASVYSHSILKCYQGAYISSPVYITHQFASRAFCSCLLDSMFTYGGNRTYSFVTEFRKIYTGKLEEFIKIHRSRFLPNPPHFRYLFSKFRHYKCLLFIGYLGEQFVNYLAKQLAGQLKTDYMT